MRRLRSSAWDGYAAAVPYHSSESKRPVSRDRRRSVAAQLASSQLYPDKPCQGCPHREANYARQDPRPRRRISQTANAYVPADSMFRCGDAAANRCRPGKIMSRHGRPPAEQWYAGRRRDEWVDRVSQLWTIFDNNENRRVARVTIKGYSGEGCFILFGRCL
jgi:hypothetical protein